MKYFEKGLKNKEMTNLLVGRKGGRTTIKIIDQLLVKPYNINQLSKILKLDYKTVEYHVELILELDFVECNGEKYGNLFFPSKKLINNLSDYEQIKHQIFNLK